MRIKLKQNQRSINEINATEKVKKVQTFSSYRILLYVLVMRSHDFSFFKEPISCKMFFF